MICAAPLAIQRSTRRYCSGRCRQQVLRDRRNVKAARPLPAMLRRGRLVDRGHDCYETAPGVVLALLRAEQIPPMVWEPACGPGAIVRVLRAAGHTVVATDLVDHRSRIRIKPAWISCSSSGRLPGPMHRPPLPGTAPESRDERHCWASDRASEAAIVPRVRIPLPPPRTLCSPEWRFSKGRSGVSLRAKTPALPEFKPLYAAPETPSSNPTAADSAHGL
jgi:hypothetical protein